MVQIGGKITFLAIASPIRVILKLELGRYFYLHAINQEINRFLKIWLLWTKFGVKNVQIWVKCGPKLHFLNILTSHGNFELKLGQYLYLYGMHQKMKIFFQICLKNALYAINNMLFLLVLWLTGRTYKFGIVGQSLNNHRVNH